MGLSMTCIKNTAECHEIKSGENGQNNPTAKSVLIQKFEKKIEEAFKTDFHTSKKLKRTIRKGKYDIGLVITKLLKSVEAEKEAQWSAYKEKTKLLLKQSRNRSFWKFWKSSVNVATDESTQGDLPDENVLSRLIDNIVDKALKTDFQTSKKLKREIAKGKCDLIAVMKRLLESVRAEKEAQWSASKDKTKLVLKNEIRKMEEVLKLKDKKIESLSKKYVRKTRQIELNSEKIKVLENMLWECYSLKVTVVPKTDSTEPGFLTGIECGGVDGKIVPVEQGRSKKTTGKVDFLKEKVLQNSKNNIVPSTSKSITGSECMQPETETPVAKGAEHGAFVEQNITTEIEVDIGNAPSVKPEITDVSVCSEPRHDEKDMVLSK